jgi:hypothetical protein
MNPDALRRLLDEQKQRKGESGLRFFDLPTGQGTDDKKGLSKVIILPAFNTKGLFLKEVYSHFFQKGKDGSVQCCQFTEPTEGWGCPVCFILQHLQRQNKDVSTHVPRPKAVVNVLIEGLGGTDEVDRQKYPYIAHILKGPRKMGDYLIDKANDPDFANFYSPRQALPLRILRAKTGPKDMDVEYDFSFVPLRKAVATTDEGMQAIAKSMYDLDRVYHYKEEHHTLAVNLANMLLQREGFAACRKEDFPPYPEVLREQARQRAAEKSSQKAAEQPAAPSIFGGGAPVTQQPAAVAQQAPPPVQQSILVGGAPAPVVATPPPPPPVPQETSAPVTVAPAAAPVSILTQESPAPTAQVVSDPPKNEAGEIIRDPSLFDPGAENPRCYRYHTVGQICLSCPYEEPCTVETYRRVEGKKA